MKKLFSLGLVSAIVLQLLASVAVQPAKAASSNLIANNSLETIDSTTAQPASWQKSSWGTNDAKFTYLANNGYNSTHSGEVQITKYTDGDAKWYFNPVTVTPNTKYVFSDYYRSTLNTELIAQFSDAQGNATYQDLGSVAGSLSWQRAAVYITTPASTTKLTVFHFGLVSTEHATGARQQGHLHPILADHLAKFWPTFHFESVAKPQAAPAPKAVSAPAARYIGVFVADSPSDPATANKLRAEKNLGINVVFNYASFDGSVAQVNAYLNEAQSLGIKVIFSLTDLYDQAPDGDSYWQDFTQYGNSNEEIALNVVRNFANHPATWGFAITDERPESSGDAGTWDPILADRYHKIKAITARPVMAVLVGASSPNAAARRAFLRGVLAGADHLALDYYPVPFQSIAAISSYAADLSAVGDGDGWFVNQAFSWNANSDYAATAAGLGFNANAARPPTADEMTTMAQLALSAGSHNILFYHYGDIAGNPTQVAALTQAISRLK